MPSNGTRGVVPRMSHEAFWLRETCLKLRIFHENEFVHQLDIQDT
jgi:hypothetical protein